jgi:cell division septation protein DedD
MEKISTYDVGVTLEKLRGSFQQGTIPEGLYHPLQSLLQRITELTVEKPISVYLFSHDQDAEFRNLFAYVLAKSLLEHLPETLLVDCEFLNVGMNDIVPEKDALGFLDLLLYGSSLGAIRQKTSGGVSVIGAGSFPVTKKMPFVLTAFEEAERRLASHSRCVIFSGPLYQDEDELHPLVGAIDVPVFVRVAELAGAGEVDPIEEQIASELDKEIFSVRISTSREAVTSAEPVVEEPVQKDAGAFEKMETPEPVDSAQTQRIEVPTPSYKGEPDEPRPGEPTEKPAPVESWDHTEELLELPYEEKIRASRLPRMAAGVIAVIIIVFVVWWFQRERPEELAGPTVTEEVATVLADSGAVDAEEGGSGVQQSTQDVKVTESEPSGEPAQVPLPADSAAMPAGEVVSDATPVEEGAIDSENILVMDDLQQEWAGHYLVHISSFRDPTKARNEVTYLERQGFPVFIVYINLASKGSWYRVYAGPLKTRDEARSMKKELDDTPRVRFTRITSVSSG